MANENYQNVLKIPELKKRLLFTLGMLAVFRIGAHIPTPGVDSKALSDFFLAQSKGTIFGLFDMFSGGALSKLTIFALGIMPYISSSIIFQLLTVIWPYLESLKKEGEAGRKKITQYTRYGTIVLSIIQGLMISTGLEQMQSPGGGAIIPNPGWGFRLLATITLTAGTAFLMWLGEQITERGIGEGISLIIFSGIVVGIPNAIINTYRLVSTGELSIFLVLFLFVVMVLVVGAIVFMEGGHRKIPIQYPRRVMGRKIYGGQSTHLPLKINTSGVIPPIFASSLILFPLTLVNFLPYPWLQNVAKLLRPGTIYYTIPYVLAIFFFCYFYAAIIFNPNDVAENLKKHGGFIPGIRPGKWTSEYIDQVLARLTFIGAIYLSLICSLPDYLREYLNIPFYFGGTSLLIVVGVAMDTVAKMESYLIMRHYEGFMKKTKMRSRKV